MLSMKVPVTLDVSSVSALGIWWPEERKQIIIRSGTNYWHLKMYKGMDVRTNAMWKKLKATWNKTSAVDPDPNWIRIQWGLWIRIRIQRAKITH